MNENKKSNEISIDQLRDDFGELSSDMEEFELSEIFTLKDGYVIYIVHESNYCTYYVWIVTYKNQILQHKYRLPCRLDFSMQAYDKYLFATHEDYRDLCTLLSVYENGILADVHVLTIQDHITPVLSRPKLEFCDIGIRIRSFDEILGHILFDSDNKCNIKINRKPVIVPADSKQTTSPYAR